MIDRLCYLVRRAVPAAVFALAAASIAAPAAASTLIYDNLATSRDGSDPLGSYGPLADSFSTGANGWMLGGVTALLGNGSAAVVGTIAVSLHADAGNAPGVELVSLGILSSDAITTSGFSSYTFAPAVAFMLSSTTTYWVEIASLTPTAVAWSWSGDLGATGVAGQSSWSAILGTTPNESVGPYQMAVSVQPVPEPSTVAALLLGMVGLALRQKSGRYGRAFKDRAVARWLPLESCAG